MPVTVLPYPREFPNLLKDYCEQIGEAIRANRHHDTRRHLFLNFLHQAFGIDPVEVELEHKIKAGELRGRIDALYHHIIVEVKYGCSTTADIKAGAPTLSRRGGH